MRRIKNFFSVTKVLPALGLLLASGSPLAQDGEAQRQAALSSMRSCMITAYQEDKSRNFDHILGLCDSALEEFLAFYSLEERDSIVSQVRDSDVAYRQENP